MHTLLVDEFRCSHCGLHGPKHGLVAIYDHVPWDLLYVYAVNWVWFGLVDEADVD